MAFMGPFNVYDVLALVGIDANAAEKHGRDSIAVPCPVCQSKRNRLFINLDSEIFHCFRCDISGGLLDLYSIYNGGTSKNKMNRAESYQAICEKMAITEDTGRKADRVSAAPVVKPANSFEPAGIEIRDKTYRTLLSFCSLSEKHLNNLLERDVNREFILQRGYKTAPQVLNDDITAAVMERGSIVKGVPGFYIDADRNWHMSEPRNGIMIPVKDIMNRIQGIQIRLDNAAETKFNWFSSANVSEGCMGCGASAWYHFVGNRGCESLVITEGPMKADIINYFTGLSVLAVPGVNNLQYALEALSELKKINLKCVVLAYDMDLFSNWHVNNACNKLMAFLEESGLWHYRLQWNPSYKGLDDFLRHVSKDEGNGRLNRLTKQIEQNTLNI